MTTKTIGQQLGRSSWAEPWKIKLTEELPDIHPRTLESYDENWKPYNRDAEKLARNWVVPGTKGMEHRIGGLEKDECTGCVSHNPQNHAKMVEIRHDKINRIADFIPLQKYKGKDATKLLVVGWGGQFGILFGAVNQLQKEGKDIAFTHFNYINPLPKNTAQIFQKFDRILVCELNKGQFAAYLRMQFPQFNFEQFNKFEGLPFKIIDLKNKFNEILNEA